jgi:minor histocompatibility antigen H13
VLLQGLLAPVLASCSLFGLYLLVKYVPDFSLQTFLDAYFWLLGSVAIFGAGEVTMHLYS